jgi:hypothetical protein
MPTLQQILQALKEDLGISQPELPSLLAHNIIWFTNCNWISQLEAFKQTSLYY